MWSGQPGAGDGSRTDNGGTCVCAEPAAVPDGLDHQVHRNGSGVNMNPGPASPSAWGQWARANAWPLSGFIVTGAAFALSGAGAYLLSGCDTRCFASLDLWVHRSRSGVKMNPEHTSPFAWGWWARADAWLISGRVTTGTIATMSGTRASSLSGRMRLRVWSGVRMAKRKCNRGPQVGDWWGRRHWQAADGGHGSSQWCQWLTQHALSQTAHARLSGPLKISHLLTYTTLKTHITFLNLLCIFYVFSLSTLICTTCRQVYSAYRIEQHHLKWLFARYKLCNVVIQYFLFKRCFVINIGLKLKPGQIWNFA